MQLQRLKSLVVTTLDDMKAVDIVTLDVRGVSDVTDIMVIASGGSGRQVKSMAAAVVEKAKEHKYRPLGMEGEQGGEWVLVDLGDVVVHIMLPEVRDFYNLEKLWGDVAQAHSAESAAAAVKKPGKKPVKKPVKKTGEKTARKAVAAAGPAGKKKTTAGAKKSVKPVRRVVAVKRSKKTGG